MVLAIVQSECEADEVGVISHIRAPTDCQKLVVIEAVNEAEELVGVAIFIHTRER